jgi:hypothetical protein
VDHVADGIKSPSLRSRWKPWVLSAFGLLLPVISFPICKEYYARWQAWKELDETIAEVDRLDPRWRLEDIEADRRQFPPDNNGAIVVLAVRRLLPKDWQPPIRDQLEKVPPHVALRQDLANQLAADLEPLRAALKQARQLRYYPLGRYKIRYTEDYVSTLLQDQQEVRLVATLLELDIALLLHQKEMANALISHRALLNAGRSIGDEPVLISSLIRIAIDRKAVRSLERIVAQGEPGQGALDEAQKALQEEIDTPLFLIGLRGDRAGWNHLLTNIETGKMPFLQALRFSDRRDKRDEASWWDPLTEFLAFSMVLRSHGRLLQFETKAIEAAKLPPSRRYQALREVQATFNNEFPVDDRSLTMARLLLPAFFKVSEAEQRVHSSLACAVAGLGAERFRLQHRRWPESLDEVVKVGFLKEVPLDLFNGQPLRLRRARDGVVVFSVGQTGEYDGTALDDLARGGHEWDSPGEAERIEFRLWDVSYRRKS